MVTKSEDFFYSKKPLLEKNGDFFRFFRKTQNFFMLRTEPHLVFAPKLCKINAFAYIPLSPPGCALAYIAAKQMHSLAVTKNKNLKSFIAKCCPETIQNRINIETQTASHIL